MKKYVYQRLLLCFVLLLTLFSAVPAFAEDAPEIVASGCCGYGTSKNLRWTLDGDGLLTISGAGYTPGDPVRENEIPAACTAAGGYDEAVFCANCPAELSRTHVETAATGHAWGEWEVIRQATASEEGLMRRTCANDPSHAEEQIIPKLQPQTNAFRQFIQRRTSQLFAIAV